MNERKLFLVCNDDGVHAPGLRALADAIAPLGDVVIVAPHVERSATSHSISIGAPLRVEKLHENVYAVEGTPADCVMVAFRKILKRRPDWVLSGINRGGNLGVDTLYSGTVGATMEGCIHGVRGLAISCQGDVPLRYDTAGQVARLIVEHDDYFAVARDGVLNVDVPSVPFEKLRGLAFTSLGKRIYEQTLVEGVDPRGRKYFWIGGGGETHEDIPNSDCVMFDDGYVTISVLKPELIDRSVTETLRRSVPHTLQKAFSSK